MTGTYDIDDDSCMRISGKDREGKNVKFTTLISAKSKEYPTQMIFIDEEEQKGLFVWKRKE
jgi:hypothetical protein